MLGGMWFRMAATATLEPNMTAITARDITMDVSSLVVTASAEQIPSTCTAIGLLLNSGSRMTSLFLAISPALPEVTGS